MCLCSGFEKTPIGKKFAQGKATLEEMAKFAASNPEPALRSGKQEALESIFNAFAYRA